MRNQFDFHCISTVSNFIGIIKIILRNQDNWLYLNILIITFSSIKVKVLLPLLYSYTMYVSIILTFIYYPSKYTHTRSLFLSLWEIKSISFPLYYSYDLIILETIVFANGHSEKLLLQDTKVRKGIWTVP